MSLRVMTYNILNGGENRESHILRVIETAQADIAILQEVYGEEFLKFLSHSLDMNYCFGEGNKKRRVALLSSLPVRSFKSLHPFFPIWRNFVDVEIEYEANKTIRIIGVHPIANLGIIFEIWRLWELKYITNHMRGYQNELCLIASDFNAIAPGEKVSIENMPDWLRWIIYLQGNRVYHFSIGKLLSQNFTDCFRFLNPNDDGFTLPPPEPNARLDYIFVNAKMKAHLKRCWIIREPDSVNSASDHYPVMAEFIFDS
ncbi:MAG TPA: endonuclease/exonuclease/phosphatase family protein [Anaerolineales bacterium]|nr:endonuclease/exonuclease/phosphatase family protein [Anaerolineales bacterium]HLO30966.1 endonuclease/exonuclease/phosphatase family protein [Anaerolineales bacterium]